MGRDNDRAPGARLLLRISRFLAESVHGPGVLAVSGGPDSVALAHLMARWFARKKLGPLILAHLNHQLRGAESDADEAFVADLARAIGERERIEVHFVSRREDVAALARAGRQNLEQTARRARYDWLAQVAQEAQVGWIATGHTADDQAETVLHHILRGTGLAGLRGIAPRRRLPGGIVLLRPLLHVSREELLGFLGDIDQTFRQDSSNRDMRFTRNRIRHELLPELEASFNPAVKRVLCRLGDQAQGVHHEVLARARRLLQRAELPRAGAMIVLSRDALKNVSRYQTQEVFRLLWKRERWATGTMTYDDWSRLAGLIAGSETAVDLTGGITARCKEHVIQVYASRSRAPGHGRTEDCERET